MRSVLAPNWIVLHKLVYSYHFPKRKSRTPSTEKKTPGTGYERNATSSSPDVKADGRVLPSHKRLQKNVNNPTCILD